MKLEKLFKKIETKNAPAAIGPYSQAIEVGNFIFTSGQIPIDPHTGNWSRRIEEQTTQVIKNLSAVLEKAGSNLYKVIKQLVFTSIGDFAKFTLSMKNILPESLHEAVLRFPLCPKVH
jgi:2-iminobutanoate/2-iminopropanoate deaminase